MDIPRRRRPAEVRGESLHISAKFGSEPTEWFHRTGRDAPKTPFWDFTCGLGAGACEAALCQTPNQSIQIKLLHDASPAVSVKQYSHLPFFRACAAIARTHGVLSFYDGLAPAVVKGALTNSVRFVGYKGITRQLDGPPTPLQSMLAGGVAGAVSAVVSQPAGRPRANRRRETVRVGGGLRRRRG